MMDSRLWMAERGLKGPTRLHSVVSDFSLLVSERGNAACTYCNHIFNTWVMKSSDCIIMDHALPVLLNHTYCMYMTVFETVSVCIAPVTVCKA